MVASTLDISEEVFIYPTDTVWGIGGSIFSESVHKQISIIKKTDDRKPLSVLCSGIDQLRTIIDLPSSFSDEWLNKYFSYESTLALPKKWAKINLPEWVCYDSEFISLRSLDTSELSKLIDKVGHPITSTSLNITSKPAIVSLEEAKKFLDTYAKNCTLVKPEEAKLSGMSSTIMAYDGVKFKCFRKGIYITQIEELIEELN